MTNLTLEPKTFMIANTCVKAELEYSDQESVLENYLVARLRARILGHDIEDQKIMLSWPANWIEAIKDRWLPYWLRKYFPVVYEQRTITPMAIFYNIPIPDDNDMYKYTIQLRQEWENEV